MALAQAILKRCGGHRRPAAVDAATGGQGAPDVGLRRVEWVRLVIGPEGTRAEAIGIGHRLPAAVPVSLRTATELMRAGTPLIVRHLTGPSTSAARPGAMG